MVSVYERFEPSSIDTKFQQVVVPPGRSGSQIRLAVKSLFQLIF